MAVTRSALAAVLGSFLLAAPLAAQAGTGTVSGRVVDSASQQPLVSVSVRVVGTTAGALTRNDGTYTIAGLRPGPQTLRATRIGFAAQTQAVTVPAGQSVTANFVLTAQAAVLSDLIITGYGAQRREAITGSVATVNADEANVHRLLDLQSFQKVYAPFDGVITVRNVDPGSLISAGSTTGTRELFRLAQVDVLRIFVFVPQSYAPDIRAGQKADVSVRELPGRVFQGTVTRTAGAIDPTSRTLLTEVQVPNPDGLLLSGSYATVRFKVQRPNPSLTVPQSALLIDASGVRVAVVNADGTLHYRPVQIGRDFGNDVEVLSGVDTTDVLATGLAANVAEGSRVEVAKPADTGGAKP